MITATLCFFGDPKSKIDYTYIRNWVLIALSSPSLDEPPLYAMPGDIEAINVAQVAWAFGVTGDTHIGAVLL